jgi:hypothetical protein
MMRMHDNDDDENDVSIHWLAPSLSQLLTSSSQRVINWYDAFIV